MRSLIEPEVLDRMACKIADVAMEVAGEHAMPALLVTLVKVIEHHAFHRVGNADKSRYYGEMMAAVVAVQEMLLETNATLVDCPPWPPWVKLIRDKEISTS